MATITEIVAAAVVHSSAAAFSHFGVVMTPPPQVEREPAVVERVVSRTPLKADRAPDPRLPPRDKPIQSQNFRA